MRLAIAGMAMAATLMGSLMGTAFAQTGQPPADPLSVKPVPPQAQSEGAETIRAKIGQAGYTEIADLARDSAGVWRARGKKGNDAVDIVVDKGGRIKPAVR